MGLVIRTATSEDAPGLTALYRELVDDASVQVDPEWLRDLGNDTRCRILIAAQEGTIIGTVLLNFCADPMYGRQPFAVIENFVVAASFRRAGVGQALLRHLEALCLAADCSKVMLLSSAFREQAHRFFAREGYSPDAKRGFVKYRRQLARK